MAEDEYSDDEVQNLIADAVDGSGNESASDQASADDDPEGADKLGDPGKKALDAMKQARNVARNEASQLREQLQAYEDRDKTEAQKLTEERDRLAVELTEHRVRSIRNQAALDAGLGSDMAQFITGVDEETAAEQAAILAEKTQSANGASADVPRYAQGVRGKGEKRSPSVSSGHDLYSQRHH